MHGTHLLTRSLRPRDRPALARPGPARSGAGQGHRLGRWDQRDPPPSGQSCNL